MKKILRFSLLFFLVLLGLITAFFGYMAWSSLPEDAKLDNGARIEWRNCDFDSNWLSPIHCGVLHTALEAGQTTSAFRLPVVVIRNSFWKKSTDPILYLSGGPGAATLLDSGGMNFWKFWFNDVKLNRDLVLFDQRGVGLSDPHFSCPEFVELGYELLDTLQTPDENAAAYLATAKRCFTRLQTENQPLDQLGTEFSASDANDLMRLLAYPRWNLYGVSYGTRLAMEIQRQYPERLRSVLLDSVYPPDKHLFSSWPSLLNESLERIFVWCDKNDRCKRSYPELRSTFWDLIERLKTQPLEFAIEERDNINVPHLLLNDEVLISIIFDAEYLPNSIAYLPKAINDLSKDDRESFRPLVENYLDFQFDTDFSDAVFWSVECRDTAQSKHDKEKLRNAIKSYVKLERYLQKESKVCEFWKNGQVYEGFHQPIYSNIPTLILTGEDDPITPSSWARDALKGYTKGHLFVFPNTSHSVLDSKPCSIDLFRHFLDNPLKRPRADCREDNYY